MKRAPRPGYWQTAAHVPAAGGHVLTVDGRPVQTPARAPLTVPSRALAEALVAEWHAQGEALDPAAMPLTRAANSAIDRVTPERLAVASMVAEYGGSDLLCYRADAPDELVARQQAAWDPWLAWSAADLGAPLIPVAGIMHQPQPEASLRALSTFVAELDPFHLTALHDLVVLSGSLVLGLAVLRGAAEAEAVWPLSRIDEAWQIEQWGWDQEAAETAARRETAFLDAARLIRLLG